MTTPQETIAGVIALMEQRRAELENLETVFASVKNITDGIGNDIDADVATLQAIDWGDGPPPPPPPPPPTSLRADGYNPDNGPAGVDSADQIGQWRGHPLGAYNVFQYGHLSREKFVDSYTKPGWTPSRTVPILAHRGLLPVLTIPGSVGDQKPDVSYASIAAGALDTIHRGNAQFIAACGPWQTDVALRIARECDTKGSWYYGDTPAQRASWRKAVAHLFNDVYAPAIGDPAVLVFCVTKRATDKDWQQAIPAGDVHRLVLSVDAYLNKPYVDTDAGFKDNWLRFVEPKVDWAVGKGLQVAFSEYAVTDEEQPANMQRLLSFFDGLHRDGRLHHAHYFGTGPAHSLWKQTKFPKTAAAYKEFWSGRQ